MADFPYKLDKRLITLPVIIYGKKYKTMGRFILDTGASFTIIDHSLAEAIGYSARDGIGQSTVSSVLGKEQGYRLILESLETLGNKFSRIEVRCHDLQEQGIEGLLGMNFLEKFDWCIHPQKQVISIHQV